MAGQILPQDFERRLVRLERARWRNDIATGAAGAGLRPFSGEGDSMAGMLAEILGRLDTIESRLTVLEGGDV